MLPAPTATDPIAVFVIRDLLEMEQFVTMLTSARLIPICVMTTPIAQTAKGLTRARVGEDFPEMERFVMMSTNVH